MRTTIFAMVLLAGTVTACATEYAKVLGDTNRRVIGPKGYTVDWDLPETGTYWVPKESEDAMKSSSEACKAPIGVFVYHHIPRPPQYSYLGFSFEPAADAEARACLIDRLKAVPSLAIYPKRRSGRGWVP